MGLLPVVYDYFVEKGGRPPLVIVTQMDRALFSEGYATEYQLQIFYDDGEVDSLLSFDQDKVKEIVSYLREIKPEGETKMLYEAKKCYLKNDLKRTDNGSPMNIMQRIAYLNRQTTEVYHSDEHVFIIGEKVYPSWKVDFARGGSTNFYIDGSVEAYFAFLR